MANISFKSITFPGLANKYQVPEISNDLATSGKAADSAKVGAEFDKVKADLDAQTGVISLIKNYYIKTSDIPIDLTPIPSSAGRMYAVVDCTAGDTFIINAYSDFRDARTWCFIDSSNNAISMSDANAEVTDLELTAPNNAAKLIINDRRGGMSYKVGNNLANRIADIEKGGSGLSDAAKAALLACLNCVGYEQNDGRRYYNALVSALYPDVFPKIVATFTPGTHVVYTDDALSTLKPYLAVKYYETSESQGETVSANDYTLSGTLTEGQASVFVSYNGMTTAFTVDAVDYYNIWHWSVSEGNLAISGKSITYNTNVTPNRLELQDSTVRKAITATRGKVAIYPSSDKYPIPIPSGATKATINITPNTQYTGPRIVKNEGSYYSSVATKGWIGNGSVITFDSGEDLFLAIPTKYDSAGSTYPTAPTNIEVIFE